MLCYAIIPARGGSKAVPRKNLVTVGGKPLLAHSIEQALATPAVNRVFVSTDDAEIAAVARGYGAEVIKRPSEISGDTASSESALLHALDVLLEQEGKEPELVVFLQATSPLRGRDDIQKAIETLIADEADSLLSVFPMGWFLWRRTEQGLVSFNYDYKARPRRQDAPEDLLENGSMFMFKPWVLRQYNNRLGGKITTYVMPLVSSFEIDEPEDIPLVEQLYTLRQETPSVEGVELLVFDFDGVMTDNRVLVDQNGCEAVLCNRSDGLGIGSLKRTGIDVMVLSTETNPVVAARCAKLNIPCVQGAADKLARLKEIVEKKGLTSKQVAFVGNDLNDLECMHWVGLPITVSDGHPKVRMAARLTTTTAGGRGAVQEIAAWFATGQDT